MKKVQRWFGGGICIVVELMKIRIICFFSLLEMDIDLGFGAISMY